MVIERYQDVFNCNVLRKVTKKWLGMWDTQAEDFKTNSLPRVRLLANFKANNLSPLIFKTIYQGLVILK